MGIGGPLLCEADVIRPLYNWTIEQAQRPYALWMLAFVSFIESSVFPIPPDILLIPMIIAQPRRAFLLAGVWHGGIGRRRLGGLCDRCAAL